MSTRLALLAVLFLMPLPVFAELLPFDVCAQSADWVRPSPDVQAKVWNDGRYKEFARDAYAWTHDFLIVLDPESTSEFEYLNNLSGLWTTKPLKARCPAGTRRSGYDWIEVWVLLHRVKSVDHNANTYTITVEPTDKGFQSVMIHRLNTSAVLRFVTPDGTELERWDESAPPRQFQNSLPPGARIVMPNGKVKP